MMKTICLFVLFGLTITVHAQTIEAKLSKAFAQFEKDAQMANGIASLYVIEAKSGKLVFEMNGKVGLAPASTQKVITSVTAYELLGNDFRYETAFGYTGNITNGELNGSLVMVPSGDPTLGSWRWNSTKEAVVLKRISSAIQKSGIRKYDHLVIDLKGWNSESIPDGWIWQDIGNYYGAGAEAVNWRENQYDVVLQSGSNIGSKVSIVSTKPRLYHYKLDSELTAAAKGTGDNAYIYLPVNSTNGVIRGTIPVEERGFVISGAMPSPRKQFAATLEEELQGMDINKRSAEESVQTSFTGNTESLHLLHHEYSPPLDSMIYWFNKRSINLYGEALVKTFAFQKKQKGDTDEGIALLKEFWKGSGIPATELNMVDGSGLSPLNRVTTKAQVAILYYAKKQPWYKGFYYAIPEFNGMKMKSGTINNVKGFTGYHTSKEGVEYIFSFLVNNYNGSAAAVVQKMYKVLDHLK